jgi:hypothetical protein
MCHGHGHPFICHGNPQDGAMIHPTFEHGTAMFMGKMMIDHENFRGTLLDKAICIWGVVLRHDHGSKLKEKNVSQCTQQNDIE